MINTAKEKILSGEGILARGIPGWCYVISPKFYNQEIQSIIHLSDEALEAYMPLPVLDSLQLYCIQVPDIAWDMLEFAEDPLIVCMKGVKNLGSKWDDDVAIMGYSKPSKDDVSLLAAKLKDPLLAFPLSGSLSEYSESISSELKSSLFCFEQSEYRTAKYKVYYLEKNGTLSRLKS